MSAVGEMIGATPGRQARTGPMPTGGRWGWYRDHLGNEYRRVSTLIKKVETDTYNLDVWKQRQVAEGLAIRDDLVLAVKAMGRPNLDDGGWTREDKKKLDNIVRDAMQAAKQRDGAKTGTAMHDLTERLDRGEPIEIVARGLPAGPATTLRAYDFLRRANGWRTVEVERTVVCDEVEAAGTFDRVEEIPGLAALLGPGECQHGHRAAAVAHNSGGDELPVVADVKTEAAPWLNGLHIAPQTAIYSRARKMWRPTGGMVTVQYGKTTDPVEVPAGEYVESPCVRQDVAVVVHLLDGQAEPYFVNLDEGWSAALAAYEQTNREARSKTKLGSPGAWFVPVPNIVRPKPAEMFVDHAAANKLGHLPAEDVAPAAVPASDLAQAMPVMVGEHVASNVGDTLMQDGERTHEAVRGPDGLVRWSPVTPEGTAGDLPRMLIAEIWQAVTVERLGELWQLAQANGVPWRGPVEQAGAARQRQIECPQRALHTAGKCACGWMTGVPA